MEIAVVMTVASGLVAIWLVRWIRSYDDVAEEIFVGDEE